jgi:hypothetical protein
MNWEDKNFYGYTYAGRKAHRVYYPRPGDHGRTYCTSNEIRSFRPYSLVPFSKAADPDWCIRCFGEDGPGRR